MVFGPLGRSVCWYSSTRIKLLAELNNVMAIKRIAYERSVISYICVVGGGGSLCCEA